MKKALIVGIDYYKSASRLYGCVNDAYAVKNALERDGDGSINFNVKLMVSSNAEDVIVADDLREGIRALFADKNEIALFYLAGHGFVDDRGGFIHTGDQSIYSHK